METRANYALIGVFTLAIIASAFAFVMWFSGGDKPGGRHTYKVVFVGSVSGLIRGAPVLFNGVRVGDVTVIDLEPKDPSHVFALVDVDGRVPIRADTKARLEATGLTGVASVALTGGAENAPPLPPGPKGGPGVIVADRSDFQDLLETARRIAGQASDFLDKSNKLLDSNSASISASVKNVEAFSDALAANAGGLKDLTGAIVEIAATAKSVRRLADDFDVRLKEIAANLTRFTGQGLRQYEALAVDGRKTLEQINQAIRSIENNPQQFLFGKKQQIPEYSGAR